MHCRASAEEGWWPSGQLLIIPRLLISQTGLDKWTASGNKRTNNEHFTPSNLSFEHWTFHPIKPFILSLNIEHFTSSTSNIEITTNIAVQLHICSLRHFIALHFLLICPTDHFCTAAKLFFITAAKMFFYWRQKCFLLAAKIEQKFDKIWSPSRYSVQWRAVDQVIKSFATHYNWKRPIDAKSADLQDFILLQNPLLFLPQQHASRRGGRLPVTFYLFSKPKFNLPSTQPQKILQTQCLICANQCNKRSTDQTNQTKDQPTKQKINKPSKRSTNQTKDRPTKPTKHPKQTRNIHQQIGTLVLLYALDLEKVWNEEKMKDNKKLYEINFVIAHKIAINLWTP